MTFASECLQGCFAELLMYCSEMLESWEEQNASCDESAQGDRPPKNSNNKKNILSTGSRMNRKLQENFRMNGEITKVRWNKLGLKSLQLLTWKGCRGNFTY